MAGRGVALRDATRVWAYAGLTVSAVRPDRSP